MTSIPDSVVNAYTFVPGWLELRGLRCPGHHGAYSGEQDRERIFVVDVAVRADLRGPAESDALTDALDFAALAAAAREVVAGRSRALLEALALDLAVTILGRFAAVEAVRVRLAKPDPPGLDALDEAVALTLERPGHMQL